MALNCTEYTSEKLKAIVASYINYYGLVHHHISSFNTFISEGIKQIITKQFTVEKNMKNERNKTEEDQSIETIEFSVKFLDVNVAKPEYTSYVAGRRNLLMPGLARINNYTYSAPIYVTAEIEAKAYPRSGGKPIIRKEIVKDFRIATIPIMVRSAYCNTYGFDREMLRRHEEDPLDTGGYFIIKGVEWVIDNIESRNFNVPHIFRNVGHQTERCRGEFISKPGDAYENSGEIKFILHTDNSIRIMLTSTPHIKDFEIPFYVIYRLYDMNTDKDIFDSIVYSYSDKEKDIVSDYMVDVLKKAYDAPAGEFEPTKYMYTSAEISDFIVNKIIEHSTDIVDKEIPEKKKYHMDSLFKNIDRYFLPHIGRDAGSRLRKLRFLGYLIHKLILVEMKIVDSTDRDSYKTKRVLAAGQSYAKAFKTQFNLTVIQQVKKRLSKDFKSTSFSQVKLAQVFKQSINSNDLEKSLVQSIVTGNEEITVKNRPIPNRLASQQLHLKNNINVRSTLRTIRTPSSTAAKQVSRADEMRRVQPSFFGIIDPIQSADTGEVVGMNKQMAYTASITGASSSELLKHKLLEDALVTPEYKVYPADIKSKRYARVFVNGEWIGCVQNSPLFVNKYRELRRHGKIDRRTTVMWEVQNDDIHFWVDAGRTQFPMLIVRNNVKPSKELVDELSKDGIELSNFGSYYDSHKDTGFIQDISLTKSQFTKLLKMDINFETLHEAGVIEYIGSDELENTYVAKDIETLAENRNNSLHRYTHCFIPIAMFGVPTSTSPYANHNQIPRITYQTNQVKQTAGWYALNWPYRMTKGTFLQWFCSNPISTTFANKYIYPNGDNAIVAICCYGGYNQEDSLSFNQTSIERGLYKGTYTHVIKAELDKDEEFGNPDEAVTIDMKRHASYAKIRNGFVKKGDIINKNDIVIGKKMKIAKPTDHRIYKDTSVMHTSSETALVDLVIEARNQEQNKFCKVKLSSVREPVIGDKFSARSGQKGVIGMTYNIVDMPFTERGIIPDIILNPHALPSRMTIGQLIEGLVNKVCCLKGTTTDATFFNKIDINSVADALEELGFERYGRERMYNGMTGEWMDTLIFITPITYQRLQKFVIEETYSISTGPTNPLTRQPIEGKSNKGGLRIGEMEKDVMVAQGCSRFIMEKFREDSDRFVIYLCVTCGKMAIVNKEKGIYSCKVCKDQADIQAVESSWATKLAIQELESMNIGVKLSTTPLHYENTGR